MRSTCYILFFFLFLHKENPEITCLRPVDVSASERSSNIQTLSPSYCFLDCVGLNPMAQGNEASAPHLRRKRGK